MGCGTLFEIAYDQASRKYDRVVCDVGDSDSRLVSGKQAGWHFPQLYTDSSKEGNQPITVCLDSRRHELPQLIMLGEIVLHDMGTKIHE